MRETHTNYVSIITSRDRFKGMKSTNRIKTRGKLEFSPHHRKVWESGVGLESDTSVTLLLKIQSIRYET